MLANPGAMHKAVAVVIVVAFLPAPPTAHAQDNEETCSGMTLEQANSILANLASVNAKLNAGAFKCQPGWGGTDCAADVSAPELHCARIFRAHGSNMTVADIPWPLIIDLGPSLPLSAVLVELSVVLNGTESLALANW